MSAKITRCTLEVFQPVPKTRWVLLTVETADGFEGLGEATLQRAEDKVFVAAALQLPLLIGTMADPAVVSRMPRPDLPTATVLSALSQALWDIAARRDGVSVAAALGQLLTPSVPLYANINRRTVERSPEHFAESARLALAAGFEAVKLAPFDEVITPDGSEVRLLGLGLERVAAVREAIGPIRDLMVDCHWRFSPAGARAALAALGPMGLHWFECPLPETDEMIPELCRLRRLANNAGMLLAGCETEIGLAGFERFAGAGAYDVVMPDIKHIGSVDEMLALVRRLEGSGVAFAPHNPSGPVSHAASLHLCAAAPAMSRLEMQFDETPLFWSLVGGALPKPVVGASGLPQGPGLGVKLDAAILASRCQRRAIFT